MTRAEADAWAADSNYSQPVYHATTAEAAMMIRQEGFDLRFWRFGRVFGHGIYAAPERDLAAEYAELLRAQHIPAEVLELRVDVHRGLVVRLPAGFSGHPRIPVLQQVAGGYGRYIEIVTRLSPSGLNVQVQAQAMTQVLVEAGYDALEIVDEGRAPRVGGSQVVVWNPRAVVIVDDRSSA
jgi:hypothetical protein